jgi:hypothetical protein
MSTDLFHFFQHYADSAMDQAYESLVAQQYYSKVLKRLQAGEDLSEEIVEIKKVGNKIALEVTIQALSEYEKKAKAAWKLPPIFDDQCKTSISQNKERLEHLPRYEITHTFKTDAGSVVVLIKTAGMNSKVTIDAGKNPMIAQAAILELEKLLTFSTLATRTNQA